MLYLISFLPLFVLYTLSSVHGKILASSSDVSATYDFVVAGGGTAGNVIANRLTEDPKVRVLVIEAGGSNDGVLDSEVPFLMSRLFGTQYDWNFTTTPQAGLGGRSISYTRGHILGGSSSINGMVYTRGSSEDYDRIAQLTGDKSWSWNQLQPYIRKHERWSRPSDNHSTVGQFDPSAHGFHGMTSVSLPGFPRSIDNRVIQTTREDSEFPFNIDMNSGNPLGVGWQQSTVTTEGRRDSSATSYLGPSFISRPNLHVLLNNYVTRLLPSNKTRNDTTTFNTVEFVEVLNGITGLNRTITADREIILSAGSVGTPHILLHSGIGDRSALSAVGITPVHHLPGVGLNFTDHAFSINVWSVNGTGTFDELNRNQTLLAEDLEEWKVNHTGYLTATTSSHIAWLRLPKNATVFTNVSDPAAGPHTAHTELQIFNGFPPGGPTTGNFIIIGTFVVTPMSRGSITLNSSNPFDQPLINPATLVHEFDRFAMREAIRSARRFLGSPAWDGYVLGPAGELASVDFSDDDQLDAYFRANAVTGLHSVGSASMSPRGATWGVTDPDLRVKGIKGIRVVDASAIPHIPSAHSQTSVYIIAERAADIIKDVWGIDV